MDRLTKLSKKYNDNPYIRSLINLIPNFGGSLDVILSAKWNSYYYKRIDNMLDQLASDLSQLNYKIDNKYLESEEFLDIVIKIVQESIETRLDDKRKIYSKIIRDSITFEMSTSDTESLIEIVSNLYEKDLFLIYKVHEYLSKTKIGDFTGEQFYDYLLQNDIQIDINEVVRVLYRFSYLGLLDYSTTRLTLRHKIPFNKTPLFLKVHGYLLE